MTDTLTLEALPDLLLFDNKVKLAGIDVDGILRGKLVSKKKFLSVAEDGFGFCSVIFGWDMHDQTYFRELKISNQENGYRDLIAVPDLQSFRRIPWEDNVPFFLVSFYDPDTKKPVCACPRGLLRTALDKMKAEGLGAMAGGKLPRPRFSPTSIPSTAYIAGSSCSRRPIALPQPSTSSFSFEPRHRAHLFQALPPPTYNRTRLRPCHPSQRACSAIA